MSILTNHLSGLLQRYRYIMKLTNYLAESQGTSFTPAFLKYGKFTPPPTPTSTSLKPCNQFNQIFTVNFNCVTTNIEILEDLSASRHWWVLSERFWPQVTAEIGSESTKSSPRHLFFWAPPMESQDSRCILCILHVYNVFNLPKINGQWIWWWFWRCF